MSTALLEPATKTRAKPARAAVPDGRAAERIATRRQGLASLPDGRRAIAVAGEALDRLAEALAGRQEALAGDRAPSLFRRELRGEAVLGIEDMARLCVEAPRAAAAALGVLARSAGYMVEPMAAAVTTSAYEGTKEFLSSQADVLLHVMCPDEKQVRFLAAVDRHKRATSRLEAVIVQLKGML